MFLFQSPSIYPLNPYILSLVDLLTRRPVDFSQIGVNRVLMDLIGVRFPINCRRSAIFVMMWNI